MLLAACGERPANTSHAVTARIERSQPYIEPVTQPDKPVFAADVPNNKPRIAIIIDDLGNSRTYGLASIALPGAVTVAIMPHTPYGPELAEAAYAQGKEIMLHMPMSNIAEKYTVTDTLTADMSRETFDAVLNGAIASVPHATGLNNHTGSELTALDEPMRWLMANLAPRGLFFIDSRTTADSVAGLHADEAGIPNASRQVFLDNEINREAIDREYRQLLHVARKQGQAIAIGHPHPETLAYLQEVITYLPQQGFELVYASELLHTPATKSAPDLQDALQQGNLETTSSPASETP
ncbi:MAG TPA: divergent polysaccharide deacetylase family protein [Pseudomonadales bacterium]